MSKFVRITATFVGDANEVADPRWKLIVNGAVEDDDRLVRAEFFGKALEADAGDWPFILEPPAGAESPGYVNFGAGFDGPRERINIYAKPIQPGALLTRWFEDRDEWVYKIASVHAM